MRLGIFGGSFDPIHNAHLIVARLACEQLGLDEVRFVVSAVQPLKPLGHGATAEDRSCLTCICQPKSNLISRYRHQLSFIQIR